MITLLPSFISFAGVHFPASFLPHAAGLPAPGRADKVPIGLLALHLHLLRSLLHVRDSNQ